MMRKFVWLMMLLFIPLVSAIGYAPIVVQGEVSFNGTPLENALISASVLGVNDSLITQSEVRSDEAGFFVFVVTVPQPGVFDLLLSVETSELLTQRLEGVAGWEEYNLALDVSDGLFISPTVREVVPPSSDEFEDVVLRLRDGVVDDDLADRFDIVVEPAPVPGPDPIKYVPPVVESPSFVSVSHKDSLSWVPPVSWEWWAVVGSVACLLFISFELKRHKTGKTLRISPPIAPQKPLL